MEDTLRVLLVEDNPGDADLLQEILAEVETARFELVRVEQLGEALHRLRREHFDVVLLDLSLPDSQGLETFSRLHAEEAGVPILVLTGLNDHQLSAQAVRRGAQDYLIKGKMTSDLLGRAIRYAIERHRRLAEVDAKALVDELTGLYNRRGLLSVAGPLCRTAGRLRKGMALLFIDVDNLKQINDTLGHIEAGDLALKETASLLRETFRESDILARVGGDEFAVLAVGVSPGGGARLAARLEENVRAHNAHGGRPYHLSLSVGLAYYDPERPCALEALLSRADGLMYQQKRAKRQAQGPHNVLALLGAGHSA
jgi:two-component system, cell cycle response regulator